MRANTRWRVVYLSFKNDRDKKPRVVTLISSKISTNTWTQILFSSADVVIIQLQNTYHTCTIFNIYNDCRHDNTIEVLQKFMNKEIHMVCPLHLTTCSGWVTLTDTILYGMRREILISSLAQHSRLPNFTDVKH
ncbi:hypothetical protein ID866_8430 [Astraeus odoratus]|nr:hypothetical protein ID866_8430 [Astraeus odoratus]